MISSGPITAATTGTQLSSSQSSTGHLQADQTLERIMGKRMQVLTGILRRKHGLFHQTPSKMVGCCRNCVRGGHNRGLWDVRHRSTMMLLLGVYSRRQSLSMRSIYLDHSTLRIALLCRDDCTPRSTVHSGSGASRIDHEDPQKAP